MPALRTPDDRFAALPGFPFAPRYLEALPGFAGLRMWVTTTTTTVATHTLTAAAATVSGETNTANNTGTTNVTITNK